MTSSARSEGQVQVSRLLPPLCKFGEKTQIYIHMPGVLSAFNPFMAADSLNKCPQDLFY